MGKIYMIEGYDGSGKTTVGKNIAKIIGAKYCFMFVFLVISQRQS